MTLSTALIITLAVGILIIAWLQGADDKRKKKNNEEAMREWQIERQEMARMPKENNK